MDLQNLDLLTEQEIIEMLLALLGETDPSTSEPPEATTLVDLRALDELSEEDTQMNITGAELVGASCSHINQNVFESSHQESGPSQSEESSLNINPIPHVKKSCLKNADSPRGKSRRKVKFQPELVKAAEELRGENTLEKNSEVRCLSEEDASYSLIKQNVVEAQKEIDPPQNDDSSLNISKISHVKKYCLKTAELLNSLKLEMATPYSFFKQDTFAEWNKPPFNFSYDMILSGVRITQADTNGTVWVQLQCMNELKDLQPIEDLSKVEPCHIHYNVSLSRKQGKIMFAKKVNGQFRRVAVVHNQKFYKGMVVEERPEDSRCRITQIDYGISEFDNVYKLIPFVYFPENLEKVPAQGFKASLQMKRKSLTDEDIKLLVSTEDLKITFNEIHDVKTGNPIISVQFEK